MKKLIFAGVVLCILSAAATAQKKPWTEWDKKEVDKILNDSAWAHVQHDTDVSEMMYSPTSSPTSGNDSRRSSRESAGATNGAVDVAYRIRFFSAKPIREAFARTVLLSNPSIKPAQLQNFVDGDYSESIVVAVVYESTERKFLAPVIETFGRATAATLKNTAYLERGDGKRVFVEDYAPPTTDGTGAKFVFPRLVDGRPFLHSETESVRFVVEFSAKIKISEKFKLSDMMYEGKVEY
jgi:hypothetical protein